VSERAGTIAAVGGDREIIISRVFDAPRELVWRAWTDPEQIVKWWGPTGFTTTTDSMDVRAGGAWRFVMHGPDGRDYPNRIEFDEVVEPERLVYRHVESVHFQTFVTFEARSDQTKVSMRMVFESRAERDRVIREYGAFEGGMETIGCLAEHLAAVTGRPALLLTVASPNEREIVMRRYFDAPRARVFDALTTPTLVKRWLLGPPGWTMPECEIDLRVGGAYRYVWRNDAGDEMGLGGVYKELSRPDRLVHTERFDEAWYPGESVISTTLVELEGVTQLTVTQVLESQAARDAILASGMESGLGVSYDRLAETLEMMEG
jgi:uncharacterized protein YndB with AHSA1/START domain